MIKDIVDLITLRNFISSTMDDMSINLTNKESAEFSRKKSQLDKMLIANVISLDLANVNKSIEKQTFTHSNLPIETTENAKELDSINADVKKVKS